MRIIASNILHLLYKEIFFAKNYITRDRIICKPRSIESNAVSNNAKVIYFSH